MSLWWLLWFHFSQAVLNTFDKGVASFRDVHSIESVATSVASQYTRTCTHTHTETTRPLQNSSEYWHLKGSHVISDA